MLITVYRLKNVSRVSTSNNTIDCISTVLESRQVSISGGRREQATTGGINYTTPLTCTIWTGCNGYNKVCSGVCIG